jgi:hypothetical protein
MDRRKPNNLRSFKRDDRMLWRRDYHNGLSRSDFFNSPTVLVIPLSSYL